MTSRYLEYHFAPLHEECTLTDLEVAGRIPDYLDGRYLRNGPNPVDDVDPEGHHWFVGDGMVHGIRIGDGKAEWYRNRWVRGPHTAKALGERVPFWHFGAAPIGANTNVIGHAGKTIALTESGRRELRAHQRVGHHRGVRLRHDPDRRLRQESSMNATQCWCQAANPVAQTDIAGPL